MKGRDTALAWRGRETLQGRVLAKAGGGTSPLDIFMRQHFFLRIQRKFNFKKKFPTCD